MMASSGCIASSNISHGRMRSSMMNRREFLIAAGGIAGVPLVAAEPAPPSGGETLYNGIRLPSPWPPKIAEISRDPVTLPYLKSPPAVIPIDVGRQLLADDFLIEETT